jgi:hypothetical protein
MYRDNIDSFYRAGFRKYIDSVVSNQDVVSVVDWSFQKSSQGRAKSGLLVRHIEMRNGMGKYYRHQNGSIFGKFSSTGDSFQRFVG